MVDLGTVRPGSTVYVPFETFAASTGAPITITGFTTADIQVYKDGSTTQRASASGYTLLDTDGIDFDSVTGIHGFSINLADNTTTGFWAAGARYFVVISTITVDGVTMSFLAASFTIGHAGAVLDTTIATLASQTSFTLTNGPAEDDALNGSVLVVHDVASAVQQCQVFVLDYTGATKTVTLAAAGTFTIAATDNVAVYPRADVSRVDGIALATHAAGYFPADVRRISGDSTAADNFFAYMFGDVVQPVNVAKWNGTDVSLVTFTVNVGTIADNAITAASIATDAIGSNELAASAVTEIQSGLSTLTAAGVRTAVGLASANLDTQLDALPTAAENATAWGTRVVGNTRTADYYLQGGTNKTVRTSTAFTLYLYDDTTALMTCVLTQDGTLNPMASVDPT